MRQLNVVVKGSLRRSECRMSNVECRMTIEVFVKGIYTLVVIAFLFISCENRKESKLDLLDRKGPISTTSEWINAKAAIQTLQNDIRKKPTDQKKKLLLAFAYMQ
ncbi:MAG TPA: hypothetical protein VK589_30890, partial [Chryseolinea sp.]|nr:hypothetical protein [Chryseolinea sp.]